MAPITHFETYWPLFYATISHNESDHGHDDFEERETGFPAAPHVSSSLVATRPVSGSTVMR